MRVSSEPGQGSTVKVFLPRVEGDEPDEFGTPSSLRGEETVLVVEDEDGVRELLWKILTEHGHTVLEARHGRDALTVAGGYNHPIHLLVTDVVMPEMGAGELVDQLLSKRPELKVLYISGYTNSEVMRRGITREDAAFIQKPFTGEELMRKVREVLDGVSRESGARGLERPVCLASRLRSDSRLSTTSPSVADSAAHPRWDRRADTGRCRRSTSGGSPRLPRQTAPSASVADPAESFAPSNPGTPPGPLAVPGLPLGTWRPCVKPDEFGGHAFDHVDRPAELFHGLVQADPEVHLRPLFRSTRRRRRLGRWRNLGARRGQRGRGCRGPSPPALSVQLSQCRCCRPTGSCVIGNRVGSAANCRSRRAVRGPRSRVDHTIGSGSRLLLREAVRARQIGQTVRGLSRVGSPLVGECLLGWCSRLCNWSSGGRGAAGLGSRRCRDATSCRVESGLFNS